MLSKTDRQILQITLPSIVSNITIPLLGLIDIAIVGHMGDIVYIGAVSVGAMIFNLIYWLFAFLRMGTSGLTSQALGQRNLTVVTSTLLRSSSIALGLALLILVFQQPLLTMMLHLIAPKEDVVPFVRSYFDIVVWGAPAVLGLNSLTGWFIGMQNTRFPMVISIAQNIINIIASLTLVYGFGMKIEGVATGTIIAQYGGLLVGGFLLTMHYGRLKAYYQARRLFVKKELAKFFSINRDIFLRTVCIVFTNLYFTSMGAQLGTLVLSANTVLMQFYLLFSYIMDGFAFAGEALGGRLYGAGNVKAFRHTVNRLFGWTFLITAAYTLLYIIFGIDFIHLLTDEKAVINMAQTYIHWIWAIPLAGAAAFIWDGIFIGTTATKGMLLSAFTAAVCFWLICVGTKTTLGNHGLWLAMIAYLALRGVIQTLLYFTASKYRGMTS